MSGGTGGREGGEWGDIEKEIQLIRKGREWGGERQSEEKRCREERRRVTSVHWGLSQYSAHCILSHLKSYQIFVRARHQNKPDDTIDTIHRRQYTIGLQEVKG